MGMEPDLLSVLGVLMVFFKGSKISKLLYDLQLSLFLSTFRSTYISSHVQQLGEAGSPIFFSPVIVLESSVEV